MKALVVLLASVLCLGGLPAEAQEAEQDQGIKVYRKIIRPEKRSMIYLSNLDGSGERELVEGSYPSLSPDQKHVAFVRESSLYRLEIETMAEKILLDKEDAYLLNRGPGNPHWHPDGRTIFFDMSNVFLVDLYSIEIDGTKFQEIRKGAGVPLPGRAWPTPFSPDGRKLLYNDCFDECYTLLVLDLETGTSVEISPHTDYGAWSPDGQKIAYGSEAYDFERDPGLFVSTVGGSLKQKLLGVDAFSDDYGVGDLSWSPDGSRIAFTKIELENYIKYGDGPFDGDYVRRIYEVNTDGSGLRERDSHYPKWRYALFSQATSIHRSSWGRIKRDNRNR